MLQNMSRNLLILTGLLGITFALAACDGTEAETETAVSTILAIEEVAEIKEPDSLPAPEVTEIIVVDENGNTNVDHAALDETLSQTATSDLSEAEIASLLFMREEEKLAHDVYVTLYDIWGQKTFINISGAEQSHTDAVKALIDRYGLQDPVDSNGVGIFENSDLQALYDQLIQQGSQSLSDALLVGVAIEEIDILDLEERIAQTDNADIILVYENLLKGSRNHLRAFVSTIARQTSETVQPQYLSQEAFDAIVNSATEPGGRGNNGGNGNGSGNGNNGNGSGKIDN